MSCNDMVLPSVGALKEPKPLLTFALGSRLDDRHGTHAMAKDMVTSLLRNQTPVWPCRKPRMGFADRWSIDNVRQREKTGVML